MAAGAVGDLWLEGRERAPELDWWFSGLRAHYTMRLMDAARAWTEPERQAWLDAHAKRRGFLLTRWLDMSLRYASRDKVRVDDVRREVAEVREPRPSPALRER